MSAVIISYNFFDNFRLSKLLSSFKLLSFKKFKQYVKNIC